MDLMMGDRRHFRRIRFYEFGYVVPWDEIVSRMEERNGRYLHSGTDRS